MNSGLKWNTAPLDGFGTAIVKIAASDVKNIYDLPPFRPDLAAGRVPSAGAINCAPLNVFSDYFQKPVLDEMIATFARLRQLGSPIDHLAFMFQLRLTNWPQSTTAPKWMPWTSGLLFHYKQNPICMRSMSTTALIMRRSDLSESFKRKVLNELLSPLADAFTVSFSFTPSPSTNTERLLESLYTNRFLGQDLTADGVRYIFISQYESQKGLWSEPEFLKVYFNLNSVWERVNMNRSEAEAHNGSLTEFAHLIE